MDKFYYTYVLRSKKDGFVYIGWTDDLRRRLAFHNAGKVASTRNRRPMNLIYYEACLLKEKAIVRERALKTGFGRKYINNRS